MDEYIVKNVKDFRLDHVFDCGQCFRWEKQADGSYTGTAMDRVVNMQFVCGDRASEPETTGDLIIKNCTEEDFLQIWKPYLDLDRDYGEIKRTLTADDLVMGEAVACGQGIRILKQDLWETIVSFIISQNNNIPRIKGCIENLSQMFGLPAGEYAGRTYYSLPGPQKLASLTAEDLAPVRLGYRTRYLLETAKMVCEKGLPEDEVQLSALCGVGPKVANCILLFSMGKYDSFPIDVWMARVMSQLYGIDEGDHKGMCTYAQEHFGQLGGFAQQYLFYYIREKNR